MRVMPYELMKKGGAWLCAARNWIQRKFVNGDLVTWGTQDALNGHLKVSDIEEFAAEIASVVVDEFKREPNKFCSGDIPPQNCLHYGESVMRLLSAMEVVGLEFVDRDGVPLGLHYHFDGDRGAMIVCRPLSDFTLPQRWATGNGKWKVDGHHGRQTRLDTMSSIPSEDVLQDAKLSLATSETQALAMLEQIRELKERGYSEMGASMLYTQAGALFSHAVRYRALMLLYIQRG